MAIDAGNKRLSFDKPLLKAHATGDFVTKGVPIHTLDLHGRPGGGLRHRPNGPTPIFPPKIDDLQMINRIGWRGFLKFQLFRPEFIEVHETSGATSCLALKDRNDP